VIKGGEKKKGKKKGVLLLEEIIGGEKEKGRRAPASVSFGEENFLRKGGKMEEGRNFPKKKESRFENWGAEEKGPPAKISKVGGKAPKGGESLHHLTGKKRRKKPKKKGVQ